MSNNAARATRPWHIFVHGRESGDGQPFATVADAADEQDALDQVKTDLNGSAEAYDRDALAPALVAAPAGCAATAAPAAHTTRTR